MSLQKDNKITRQVQEQHMESEDSPWTLESLTTISRMESQSTLIVINMDIWQRNADTKRRNKKYKLVSNVTRRGTLPKTVNKNS